MACDRLTDGHGIIIEFFDDPDDVSAAVVSFWEISVTPPSIMGGGAIRTTTMRNETLHTKVPKRLKELGDMKATVSYSPEIFEQMNDIVQVLKWVRITWPDGEKLGFWGWLDELSFNEVESGEQPEAEITVICANQNPDCE